MKSKRHIAAIIAGAATLLALLAATWGISRELETEFSARLESRLSNKLATIKQDLEYTLRKRLAALPKLVGAVQANPTISQAEFEVLARELYKVHSDLRNLQLARYSVISHQYPITRNRGILGLNLLSHPRHKPVVERTIKDRKVTIEGPIQLVQGGSGLVARTAIFIDTPEFEGYWGLAAVVIDVDALLAEAGVFMQLTDLEIGLRGADGLGDQGEVFFGNPEIFQSPHRQTNINLPNGIWVASIRPNPDNHTGIQIVTTIQILGALLSLAIALLVWFAVNKQRHSTWVTPTSFAVVFLAFFGALLWMINERGLEIARQSLIEDTDRAHQVVRARLSKHTEFLQILARDLKQPDADENFFQTRAQEYGQIFEEVENIDLQISTNANITNGKQSIEQANARNLAIESHRLTFSAPFKLNNEYVLEIWLPTYQEQQLEFVIQARYRLQKLLDETLSLRQYEPYWISLLDKDETLIASIIKTGLPGNLQHRMALNPPGHAVAIQLSLIDGQAFNQGVVLLALMAAIFGCGLFWGIWALQRTKTSLEQTVQVHTRSLLAANQELIQEISDRERAEAALQDSEERYRRLVEGLRTSYIFSIDPTGMFSYVSAGVKNVLGYTQEEFLTHYTQFYTDHPENRQAKKIAEANLRGELQPPFEVYRRHKDGSEIVLEVSEHPVVDETGKLLAVEGIAADITGRKRAERELRKYREDLEQLVSLRTASLEIANKELESFSYSVSHDLRSPLRSIDGFSKLLLDDYTDKLDEPAKQHLSRIRAASQRMGKLIDSLLTLARLSRRKLSLKKVDLSQLALETCEHLQTVDPNRAVEFIVSANLKATGDIELLRVVIENLLGNAWKYTARKNKAKIEFGVTAQHEETMFFIRDNGVGFDMQYSSKLFTAFERLHTDAEFSGTGIGLATVARILRRHQGRVWAESSPGNGATFYFTLPRTNIPSTPSIRQSAVNH